MKISLEDIQSAFFGDDVPRKNIALRKAHDEIQRLQKALKDVTNPIEYLRRHAEADGNKLNGMAYSVASDLHFVQKIARDALDMSPPPPSKGKAS